MRERDPAEMRRWMLLQCFAWEMEREFLHHKAAGMTHANTKEEYFGFNAADVAEVHRHKQGFGSESFFRLKDDRVFDSAAQPHEPDRALYDATTH